MSSAAAEQGMSDEGTRRVSDSGRHFSGYSFVAVDKRVTWQQAETKALKIPGYLRTLLPHTAQCPLVIAPYGFLYLKKNNVKPILEQLSFYKKAHKSDRSFQFWQEGVHPELIQNTEIMAQKIEYIHNNPVKRGYVDNPEHWRYSSARAYEGQHGLLELDKNWA